MTSRLHLSRRNFLRGSGALVALPFLESLWPRALRADTPPVRKRFIAWYMPNGMHMPAWTPSAAGRDFMLPPILAPLAPVRGRLLVLSGLSNQPAVGEGGGAHATGTAAFLTAAHPLKTDGADIRNGVSIDQAAAQLLGSGTPYPSLQLGIDSGGTVGACENGYSCAYMDNISWSTPSTPLPKLVNPHTIFDRLFGNFSGSLTRAEIDRRNRLRRSVLDHTLAESQSLRTRLSRTDQAKLDEHLGSVRAAEQRLQSSAPSASCQPGAWAGEPVDYAAAVAWMNDVMVLAMRCDLSRVISFMLGNGRSDRAYPFLGIPESHHDLSHHMGDASKQAKLQIIDTWEIQQLASLLIKMQATDDGGGASLLDNSLVFASSEVSDGDTHSHDNLPVLVAGRGGGGFETGRHVVCSTSQMSRPPIASLFVSLLNVLGVNAQSFGDDGTGPLAALAV